MKWVIDVFKIFTLYRVLQSITEYYRVLQSITEYYRVLQSVTECCRVLQSVTDSYRVFLAHLLGLIFGLVVIIVNIVNIVLQTFCIQVFKQLLKIWQRQKRWSPFCVLKIYNQLSQCHPDILISKECYSRMSIRPSKCIWKEIKILYREAIL